MAEKEHKEHRMACPRDDCKGCNYLVDDKCEFDWGD